MDESETEVFDIIVQGYGWSGEGGSKKSVHLDDEIGNVLSLLTDPLEIMPRVEIHVDCCNRKEVT